MTRPAYFFCVLEEDRCKLRFDLPPTEPQNVGAVRAALKAELGWRSSEISLYQLAPQHKDKRFDIVELQDCLRLVDDEAPLDTNLFFVKRRVSGQPHPEYGSTPAPREDRGTPMKRKAGEAPRSPDHLDMTHRKTRRTEAPLSPATDTTSITNNQSSSDRMVIPPSYPATENSFGGNSNYFNGSPRMMRDAGFQRPPSPPSRYDTRRPNSAHYLPFVPPAAPPPPPPPPRSQKRYIESDRRRHFGGPSSSSGGGNNPWNTPPKKMESSSPNRTAKKGSKGLDVPRQPSRPRAPVVHNLISKQLFLEDLQSIVAKACHKRDGKILPYQVDSLGDICITHEVQVPATYSWERIQTAPEFQLLSPAHRTALQPAASSPTSSPESSGTVEPVKEFATTICFVEVAQERLLVFDWFVYALEAVAEYRDTRGKDHIGEIFYIYGQPRIGKSICVLFLAIAASFVGETVYYFCDSRIWEISSRGVTRWNPSELLNTPKAPAPDGPHRFLFAELRVREQEEVLNDLRAVGRHLNLVIVASGVPDQSLIESRRWKEQQTTENRDDPVPYFFVPPPAWHELYALKILVYPTISRAEFEFRYFMFGPIPRNIISETGPFGYILDTWARGVPSPSSKPAPDLLDSDAPRLSTLILPVDQEGNTTLHTGTKLTLTYISAAVEALALGGESSSNQTRDYDSSNVKEEAGEERRGGGAP